MIKIMCKYQKDIPQPKNLPYPRASFTGECGFKLVLIEGYDMDWKNNKTYGKPIFPKGKCMKCNTDIEADDYNV
jgi:hypothetical protein